MAKKITPPSIQTVELVLGAADNCARPNGTASRQLDAAVQELATYFREVLQINAGRSGSAAPAPPQASSTDAGSASDQV